MIEILVGLTLFDSRIIGIVVITGAIQEESPPVEEELDDDSLVGVEVEVGVGVEVGLGVGVEVGDAAVTVMVGGLEIGVAAPEPRSTAVRIASAVAPIAVDDCP